MLMDNPLASSIAHFYSNPKVELTKTEFVSSILLLFARNGLLTVVVVDVDNTEYDE